MNAPFTIKITDAYGSPVGHICVTARDFNTAMSTLAVGDRIARTVKNAMASS